MSKTATTYKDKLKECLGIQGNTGIAAHRRAKLLNEVFEDADFMADIGTEDPDAVSSALDPYVEDLCLTFAELRTLISVFPNVKDWKDGKLATLYERCLSKLEADKQDARTQTVAHRRTVIKKADYEAVVQERDDLKYRLGKASEKLEEMEPEVVRLRGEFRELLRENAELKQQISELETQLSRSGETVCA